MLRFEKPEYKVVEYVENNFYGKFELEPLEKGFGTTIGNALRRVMLSNLPGSAITSIKIEGVMHEFQKIDGIVEDVTEIILNLKNLVVKNYSECDKVLHLKKDKEGVVTARDIDKDSDVEIVNEDLVIATISKGGSLDMELTVSNGRGYVDAKTNATILKKPTFLSNPFPEITSIIASLTCSGIILSTNFATKSIDISNDDASKTITVKRGIIASIK